MKKDFRATWPQAFITFFAPMVMVLLVRWILLEPFVIPSGSMIPTLLIHDHIFVNKLAFGIHVPFSKKWFIHWSNPKHDDIAVFRYPETPEVYFVKRIVGLPGDEISVEHGTLSVNGEAKSLLEAPLPSEGDEKFKYFTESQHLVRYMDKEISFFHSIKVPEGQYFAMGDNRDQSSDSRVWGFIPEENFVGTVQKIWLSCEKTLPSASFLCDPSTIRWNRLLLGVQ